MAKHAAVLQTLSRVLKEQRLHAPLALNSISFRAMSRLFVGGLSFRTEEESLRNSFAAHGEVIDARIITDRETGKSRGFGFVTFLSDSDAETAIGKMDGQFLDGRVIRVNRATPRPAPPRFNPDAEGLGNDTPASAPSEDWGTIPASVASVPQNAGFSTGEASDSGTGSTVSASNQSLGFSMESSSLESPSSSPKLDQGPADLKVNTRASAKDTGESFDFIDLNLSNLPPPDPNQMPRPRPPRPRVRPSSFSDYDYDYGYPMSDSARFPYNTNFNTGIPKPSGPDFDFDFPDLEDTPSQTVSSVANAS